MNTHDLLIGQQLGDYRIVDVIGHGGMGHVYKGYDEKLERYSAVKVFDTTGVTGDEIEEYRERFQREARAVARLRHPNIVDVYQFGQTESLYYMAMVLVEGRDLRHIMKTFAAKNERMPAEAMLRVMTDIALALDYAHKEGVIHRDIKPSNLMIKPDGHAILTDFGLALNVPEGTIGTTFGSVHYIAPEQAMNSALAVPQSDLYSLGVILYEILTGKVPFDDQSAMSIALQHVADPPPPPRRYNPDIAPVLEAMVLRTLDKEPEGRYGSGIALIEALENALGMIDEDEQTREIIIPDWVKDPEKLAEKMKAMEESAAANIPAPVVGKADDDTLGDKPVVNKLASAPSSNRARNIGVGAGVLVLIALVVVIGLVIGGSGGNDGNNVVITPTVSGVGVVLAATDTETVATDDPSDTPVPSIVTPEPEATDDSPTTTPAPTEAVATDTLVAPTATPVPTGAVATDTLVAPTATSAQATLAVTAATGSDDGAQVVLLYDEQTLILINRSTEPIDVSGLTFVQVVADGPDLTFPTRRWADGSAPHYALPAGGCFQVWTTEITQQPMPESCESRHKWDQAAASRWFWISNSADTLFDVRRGDTVLAQCRVGDGECAVDVRQ